MRLWIFSDLHLTEPNAPLYREFLMALNEPVSNQDVVVFAGDIFDLFVGDSRVFTSKNSSFFNKLTELHAKRVKMYYIEGNHDFQMEAALSTYGVSIVPDEIVITDPDSKKNIYIAHGDLVDQTDIGYLRLRQFWRSAILRAAIRVAPGELIENIARRMGRSTQKQEAEIPEKWSPQDRTQLREKYRNFARKKVNVAYPMPAIDFVVLGHCHDLDEEPPFYWNMGYPPVHRQFLYYESKENTIIRREFPRIS